MNAPTHKKDRYAHIEFEGVRFPGNSRVIPPAPLLGDPNPVAPVILPQLDPNDYSLLAMVLGHVGVDLECYRREALIRRVPACLRALRVRNSTEACELLQSNPSCFPLAVDALLIGVTHFFRDNPVFSSLEETIIPDILARASGCRVLSMACSEGAELYSIAMILAERGVLEQSYLCGIDCRQSAINSAREGIFAPGSLKEMPVQMQLRYFATDSDRGAAVCGSLRNAIDWQVADALTFESKQKWDLILCRNMAIYLNTRVANTLWSKVNTLLASGGYLIVGKAERPAAGFIRTAPCVYRKH